MRPGRLRPPPLVRRFWCRSILGTRPALAHRPLFGSWSPAMHAHRPGLPLRAAATPSQLLPLARQPEARRLQATALAQCHLVFFHVHRPGLPLRAAAAPPLLLALARQPEARHLQAAALAHLVDVHRSGLPLRAVAAPPLLLLPLGTRQPIAAGALEQQQRTASAQQFNGRNDFLRPCLSSARLAALHRTVRCAPLRGAARITTSLRLG